MSMIKGDGVTRQELKDYTIVYYYTYEWNELTRDCGIGMLHVKAISANMALKVFEQSDDSRDSECWIVLEGHVTRVGT